MMNKPAILFVLLAAVLWGTTGTAQAFLSNDAHPIVVGAIRLAIGGSLLLLLVTRTNKPIQLSTWPKIPLIVSVVAMAVYQPFFFTAVSVTGVTAGTVIAIGSAPIMAGLLEWFINRKMPQLKWWLATALAIMGCFLLTTGATDTISFDPIGILFALGAGLSFATYTLFSKSLLDIREPDVVVAIVFSFSALLLVPIFFFYDVSWLFQWQSMVVALHLGAIATAIAYLLFAKGLSKIPGSLGVTLALAEPLTASLLGVLIVGERLPIASWFGVLLLLGGLIVASMMPKKKTLYQ
ncbi:EamA family transporter [Shouchella patagoniensis]|uniref:EamA family transporter n=1 Tax=Shouchella patagoniensis TaxID=228576 RepID=UPI0009953139|nr:EamA family transporter [Shouchella patagoniensis]